MSTPATPFLKAPPVLQKLIKQKCKEIENDNSRYTAQSRAKYAVQLIEVIATLTKYKDLKLLMALWPEPSEILAPADAHSDTVLGSSQVKTPANDLVIELGRTGEADDPSSEEIFRNSLSIADSPSDNSNPHLSLPSNWGLDLDRLRRLSDKLHGKSRTRHDIEHSIEAATPRLVRVDYRSSTEFQLLKASSAIGDTAPSRETADDDRLSQVNSAASGSSHFARPRWRTESIHDPSMDEAAYRKTVAALKRKRVFFTNPGYQPHYSYGISRKIEEAVKAGRSAIISGISGTGKSTLLANVLPDDVTVFELGGSGDRKNPQHFVFEMYDFECMLKKARRVKGRKLLVCHEFFVGPTELIQLGIFDQIVLVGDPRQPGAFANPERLYDFIKAIGGASFKLSVVWRATNPLSMMGINYFAYGSGFKVCPRTYRSDPGYQFDLIECDDSPIDVASCLLTYALQKACGGKSVIIAVGNEDLVMYLDKLLALHPAIPDNLKCHYLANVQGLEADILIVDLHDVATAIPKPHDAMRFFIMMLGRARSTTCFALGKRNMASDRGLALPIEVFAGVLLRYRVRSVESKTVRKVGPQFDQLMIVLRLVPIDEETIAVFSKKSGYADIMLVKDRESHNASMVEGTYCTIEAPNFFDDDACVEDESELLLHLFAMKEIPLKSTFSFAEIKAYIVRRGAEPPHKSSA